MVSAYSGFWTISLWIYYRKWQLSYYISKLEDPHDICIFVILDNSSLDLLQKMTAAYTRPTISITELTRCLQYFADFCSDFAAELSPIYVENLQ